MGSVVLDAVNTFFGHSTPLPQHAPYREASPPPVRAHHSSPPPPHHQPKRGRTPSCSAEDRPMSQRVPSGSSSSATDRNAPRESPSTQQQAGQPPSQASRPADVEPPPSPGLNGRSKPAGGDEPVPATTHAQTAPSPSGPQPPQRKKIKVRDLQHIQTFATEDMTAFSEIRSPSRSRSSATGGESPQYEISEMKVEHIIEMVAGLLTKITSTNDQQHEHLHRQPPSIESASGLSPQTTSVLAFHGKNVPSITILSYLSRINKYCPTSYEVFLSLLVYFDRMTERVNAGPMRTLREANEQAYQRNRSAGSSSSSSMASDKMEDVLNANPAQSTQTATPPASGSLERATQQNVPGTPYSRPQQPESPSIPFEPSAFNHYNLSHFFVVDSFNIHRLVIAGVTCASKFFSDIFYTNSRYAKVGGLPLPELNHLELQFLLLNDFRLSIPVEEIEAYGTMLVEFYAREVVAQQRAADAMQMRSLSESSSDSTSTVRATS